MPSPDEILAGLTRIAQDAVYVSIGWHVAVLALAAAVAAGFRPSKRVAALALSAPVASVAALAFAFGNPFNGTVFTALALSLAALALRAPRGAVELRTEWSALLGVLLILFGMVYPHFLEGASFFAYLYAAPLGAVPCPTLALTIGAALLFGGFGLGAFRLTLAGVGGFYAVFGALRLGVLIDAVLLCGALGLAIQYAQDRSTNGRVSERSRCTGSM